jgi:hypothetical protein
MIFSPLHWRSFSTLNSLSLFPSTILKVVAIEHAIYRVVVTNNHEHDVDADPGAKHWNGPPGDALCGGADVPRHRVGRSATWRGVAPPLGTFGRSAPGAWTDCDGAGLDLVSGKGPRRGGEILGCVLVLVGHPIRL